jgi:hypothetical protein
MVKNVTEYIGLVNETTDYKAIKAIPWFRGLKEDLEYDLLLPAIYKGFSVYENQFIQQFRNLAYTFGDVPEFSRIDQWLFLMQHCGLPTRLLDWTENSLAALYFSINNWKKDEKCIVYVLNPQFLNFLSYASFGFQLTWIGYKDPLPVRIGNIRAAFEGNRTDIQTKYPIAVYPETIHPRVSAQKGTFTVHGYDQRGIEILLSNIDIRSFIKNSVKKDDLKNSMKIFEYSDMKEFLDKLIEEYDAGKYLKRIDINVDENNKDDWLYELKKLGVSQSVLFPDFDGLAREIKMNFKHTNIH